MATYTWSQYAQFSTWVIVSGTFNIDSTLHEVLASDSTFYVTLPNRSIALTSNVDGEAQYYVPRHSITLTYPSGNTITKYIGADFTSSPLTKGTTVSMPAITTNNSFTTATFFTSSNPTTAYIDCPVVLASAQITYTNSGTGYMSAPNITITTVRVRLNMPPTFIVTDSGGTETTQVYFDTNYVYAGLTTASVKVADLSAKRGGTITSATLTIGEQTTTRSDDGELSILLNAGGTFTPTVTVTDSRGQTTTQTLDPITVNVYTTPSVVFSVERTLQTGVPDDEGTYVVITPTFTFVDAIATLSAPTVTATDEGSITYTPTVTWYSSRASDGTLSGSVTWSSLSSGDIVYGLLSLQSGFDVLQSYQISVTPIDSEGTGTAKTQMLAPAFFTIDILAGGHGLAFGKPAINTGFECAMDATFEDTLTAQDMTAQEVDDFVDSIGGGGDPVADVVVEVGKTGDWGFRKWSSGIAECWVRLDQSNSATQHNFNGNFPISFLARPSMVASGGNYGNVNSRVAYCNASATSYDVYTIGDWANGSFVQIYVIGWWK